jgi:hypothetical protein
MKVPIRYGVVDCSGGQLDSESDSRFCGREKVVAEAGTVQGQINAGGAL